MTPLPTELLQVVFENFVLVLCGDPKILCKISRKWRLVAFSTPKIWSRIVVVNENTLLRWYHSPDVSYTVCNTEGKLKTILARAGSAKLEVSIDAKAVEPLSNAWTTVDRDWLSKRCRKLTLVGTTRDDGTWIHTWVHNLVELEELVLREFSIFAKLYEDLQENSVKLSLMELRLVNASGLAGFQALLARLRTLRVTHRNYQVGMHLEAPPRLDFVEELLWGDLSSLNPLPLTSNHLRVLTLARPQHLDLSETILNSLTELQILDGGLTELQLSDGSRTFQWVQGSLVLPALKTLVIQGSGVRFAHIYTPALRTLRLLRGFGSIGERRDAIFACNFRPRILHIELCVATTTLVHLLQRLWYGIEELHCTYRFSDDFHPSPTALIDHLSQPSSTNGTAEICSQLSVFTALFDWRSRPDLRRDIVVVSSAMQRMVESRRGGFHPLTVALLRVETSGSYGDSTEWKSFT